MRPSSMKHFSYNCKRTIKIGLLTHGKIDKHTNKLKYYIRAHSTTLLRPGKRNKECYWKNTLFQYKKTLTGIISICPVKRWLLFVEIWKHVYSLMIQALNDFGLVQNFFRIMTIKYTSKILTWLIRKDSNTVIGPTFERALLYF